MIDVWASIRFNSKSVCHLDELWVKIQLPCLVPVGTTIRLPTPKGWNDEADIESEVKSWHVHGTAIECQLAPETVVLDSEALAELHAIGYRFADGWPQEILDAMAALRV